ncbi:probable methyltransferase At1g27930 [Sorghum bicolor]|nr:probable methyltransferase At1g27930 [Sorghum bicolor]|eukprot:XP_002448805.1 probable methyltransferase At1g27930 [Sorghum bicolor]
MSSFQMHLSGGGGGGAGSRMMPPKQLLTIIIIIFSTLSFIKLLFLTSSSFSSAGSTSRSSPAWDAGSGGNGTARSALAAKELALLRSVVTARAPCRLLVFGLSPQLLALAKLNSGAGAGATTAFVTDSADDADAARHVLLSERGGAGSAAAVAVHRARYRDAAAEAWPLLRRARGSPACRRPTGTVRKSGCPLALTSLPREVLDTRWDVVVVDGPSGAAPEEPGRMGTIYTAAALARAVAGGEAVDVAVHDVDRTVERWYAWEYLCEDNLVAAKGRLWHFRIAAGAGPTDAFCSIGPVQIL